MKKISLLKDCFSKDAFKGKSDKDEMIIYERNKITFIGMNTLTFVLIAFGGVSSSLPDIFNFNDILLWINIILGAVHYSMLIAYCKKGIVKHSFAFGSFLWSIILLPIYTVDLFLDKIIQGKIYGIIEVIVIIIVALMLYFICNIIYKKSFDED